MSVIATVCYLGASRVKNWRSRIFGKKSYIRDNTQKQAKYRGFFVIEKIVHSCEDLLDLNHAP